ncbi:type II secretion system protein [Thalassotalea sp. M1531]|uniref:Type II secretion system protein n=1 Tax=Thalassotalea algicola TaxID=2716224 RepID=A0A7Y0LC89_9GAMM|nr:type II secretion system protein [Thalassotalea algicola]NMP31935.1 type II secretion system protein [Thalassotalea algicola]
MSMRAKGFTLIEMVMVIILLGIVSVTVGSMIRMGSQAFVDVSNRDELISSARFSVERLNRELRAALPNSVRLTDANTCIELIPSVASTVYTDAPVPPETVRNTIDIIAFDSASDAKVNPAAYDVAIYPIDDVDLYAGSDRIASVQTITEPTATEWQIELTANTTFAEDSPTQRLYFIERNSVKYCITGTELTRNTVLMAENLAAGSAFTLDDATHQRNSIVTTLLIFERNNERVTFNNEVQVINVP